MIMNEFYLPNITCYSLILIVSSLLLFIIGRAIVCLLPEWRDKDNPYQTTLNSFLLGYTTILPLFAIIWSKANSLFWLVVVLWILYLWWWRKPQKAIWRIDIKSELRAIALSIGVLLGSFALLYYLCFVRSEGQIFSDQIYATNLAHSILSYHNEAYFRTSISIAQTYHWGDSWTTALWALLFNAKPLYVLYCVTYPFLLSMCVLGIITLVKGMPEKLPIVLCVLLGVLYFFFWNISSLMTPWHGSSSISGLKNYLMKVFVIWSTTYIIKSKYPQGFFAVLMLVAYYSPLAPGVLALVCLLSYFLLDKQASGSCRILSPYIIGAVIVACCYGLFYFLQPDIFTEGAFSRHANRTHLWILGFIVKRICRPITSMTPAALLVGIYIFKYNRDKLRKYGTFYLCILGSCLVACVVGGFASLFEVNAGQIAANYYEVMSNLFVCVSLIFLLSQLYLQHKILISSLIIIASIVYPFYFFYNGAHSSMFPINPMSQDEKNAYGSLQGIFAKNPVNEMGYLRNYSLPENHNTPKTEYDLYFPMDRLVHILPKGYHPYCLSAYDIPDDIDPMWNDMAECELWQYGAKIREASPNYTDDQIVSSFVEQKSINYIFVEKGATFPWCLSERFAKVFEWDGNVLYYAK